jgi:hypothetical protein
MTAARVAARQCPIHEWNVDLADLVTGRVYDIHARQKAELDSLLRQRVCA